MSEWRKLVHLQALKRYFLLHPGSEDQFKHEAIGIINALEILPAFEENGKIYRLKNEKVQFWLNPAKNVTQAPFRIHFIRSVTVSSYEVMNQEIINYLFVGSWTSAFHVTYPGRPDELSFFKAISYAHVGVDKLYPKIMELLQLEFSFHEDNYKGCFKESKLLSEITYLFLAKSINKEKIIFRPEILHILANALQRPILLFGFSSSQHVVPELIRISDWKPPIFLSQHLSHYQVLDMKEDIPNPHLRFIAPQFTFGLKVFTLPQLYEYFNTSPIYRKFDIGPINPKENF
jgi:hypothetical protein